VTRRDAFSVNEPLYNTQKHYATLPATCIYIDGILVRQAIESYQEHTTIKSRKLKGIGHVTNYLK
jgi:hypothetical protein